jgi:hypothetical protein
MENTSKALGQVLILIIVDLSMDANGEHFA